MTLLFKPCSRQIKHFLPGMILTVMLILPLKAFASQTAVVGTIDPAWTSAALSIISVEKVDGKRSANNLVNSILNTDFILVAYGDYFYRIERMDFNSITKYDVKNPETMIYQYSCQGEDIAAANPHDLIFLSEQKAYLLRYGSTKAWIVNPSATTQAEFKTGEIDFSAYADNDGVPEMHKGTIVDGKLFVNIQRIDFSGGWGNYVYNTSYIAVIDTDTDTEIDTGKGEGGMKGIPSTIKNTGEIQYLPENNMIYIQGSGTDGDLAGGIVSLNPDTYEVTKLVDDDTAGDGTALYGGRIFGMAIVSAAKSYFVSYHAWGDCTVYEFNPSTGSVTGEVTGLQNLDISGMSNGIYADENDMLWVNSGTAGGLDEPSIIIYDPSSNTIDEVIETQFNPGDIVFCGTISTATEEDDDDGSNSDRLCFIQTAGFSFFKTLF